ncbi:MAG: hypothetical protein HYU54_03640 [Actinobacteria bacterium]|nr:hypothetical protein [Actinomycetota bacterium]
MRRRLPVAFTALLVALGLLGAACASSGPAPEAQPPSGSDLQVVVASVDLYMGTPQRFLVGLPFTGGQLLSYGTVELRFSYTGPAESPVSPEPGPTATASYVPTPGTPEGAGSGPTPTQPSEARGVYQATGLTFDRAGIWEVEVAADVEGTGPRSASAAFQVAEEPSLPAPGQPALMTDNLTIRSKDAPEAAVDSRAAIGERVIPDPQLHRWTIARAIAEHRPALVVFATPVYCVSRFCGPVTDLVAKMAKEHAGRAVFIHVEIWRDFEGQVVNKAAADWLYRNGDLTEPWLFLIGPDGTILDRWSSLWSEREVAAELQQLPA